MYDINNSRTALKLLGTQTKVALEIGAFSTYFIDCNNSVIKRNIDKIGKEGKDIYSKLHKNIYNCPVNIESTEKLRESLNNVGLLALKNMSEASIDELSSRLSAIPSINRHLLSCKDNKKYIRYIKDFCLYEVSKYESKYGINLHSNISNCNINNKKDTMSKYNLTQDETEICTILNLINSGNLYSVNVIPRIYNNGTTKLSKNIYLYIEYTNTIIVIEQDSDTGMFPDYNYDADLSFDLSFNGHIMHNVFIGNDHIVSGTDNRSEDNKQLCSTEFNNGITLNIDIQEEMIDNGHTIKMNDLCHQENSIIIIHCDLVGNVDPRKVEIYNIENKRNISSNENKKYIVNLVNNHVMSHAIDVSLLK